MNPVPTLLSILLAQGLAGDASAVIIDHLTPPLTRAESYGPLRDLEALVDEYYEAAGVDPRRIEIEAIDKIAVDVFRRRTIAAEIESLWIMVLPSRHSLPDARIAKAH